MKLTDESGCFEFEAKDIYTQCLLVKKIPGGTVQQISWIPHEFAEEGGILKIRDHTGAWVDGWKVVRVYSSQIGCPYVEKVIREHKQRTGDVTKKRKHPPKPLQR
jgi:hypothetical protein